MRLMIMQEYENTKIFWESFDSELVRRKFYNYRMVNGLHGEKITGALHEKDI